MVAEPDVNGGKPGPGTSPPLDSQHADHLQQLLATFLDIIHCARCDIVDLFNMLRQQTHQCVGQIQFFAAFGLFHGHPLVFTQFVDDAVDFLKSIRVGCRRFLQFLFHTCVVLVERLGIVVALQNGQQAGQQHETGQARQERLPAALIGVG